MTQALEAKDAGALKAAYEAATARGMSNDAYNKAKIAVERQNLVEKTNAVIHMSDGDFDAKSADDPVGLEKALNDALENAISLGLSQDDIATATGKREKISAMADSARVLAAAVETLKVKTASPSGIVAADLPGLESAVGTAPAARATAVLEHAKKQIEVQAQLTEALQSKQIKT